jgi:hypothetical protein
VAQRVGVPHQLTQFQNAANPELDALHALASEHRLEAVDLVTVMYVFASRHDQKPDRPVNARSPEHDGVSRDRCDRSSERRRIPPSDEEHAVVRLKLPAWRL